MVVRTEERAALHADRSIAEGRTFGRAADDPDVLRMRPFALADLWGEERLDVLDNRLDEMKLNKQSYWWYRDLRRYGTVPHAGFGLGFERAIQYATGVENIRDVIPFPRAPRQAEF